MAALRDKNVCGFDVSMNYPFGVGCIEPVSHLDAEFRMAAVSVGCPPMRCFSVTPSRYSIAMKAPVLLSNLVDGADVRVIQRRGGFSFAPESSSACGFEHIVRQKFEGYETVQACVFGLIDDTHASATEFLNDAVAANCSAEDG